MTVDKLSVSLDRALADQARATARREGQALSAFVADAVAAWLRLKALDRYLDEHQREQGAFTDEEIAHAETVLGLRRE